MKRPVKYGTILLGSALLLPGLMLWCQNWKKTRLMAPSDKYYLCLKYLLLEGFPVHTAKLIAAQFAHETGNFRSELFEKANNPAGMKAIKAGRDHTQSGDYKGYAKYESLADGVKDYALWFQAAKMPGLRFSTPEKFVQALKEKGYFTDNVDNYLKGVNYFFKLYNGGNE